MLAALSLALHMTAFAAPGSLPLAPVVAAPEADIEAGEAAWRDERWNDASAAFAKAYARTGDPTFLYTRAQAERRAGHCALAIVLYEEFIASAPAPKARAAAEKNVEECRATMPVEANTTPVEPEPGPEPEAQPDGGVDPGQDSPVAEREPAPVRPWHRDPLGGALVGGGLAVAVVGGTLVGLAYRTAKRAPRESDEVRFAGELDQAHTLDRAGGVMLGIGSALIVGGVVRWVVVGRRRPGPRVAVGPRGLVVSGTLPSLGMRSR